MRITVIINTDNEITLVQETAPFNIGSLVDTVIHGDMEELKIQLPNNGVDIQPILDFEETI